MTYYATEGSDSWIVSKVVEHCPSQASAQRRADELNELEKEPPSKYQLKRSNGLFYVFNGARSIGEYPTEAPAQYMLWYMRLGEEQDRAGEAA